MITVLIADNEEKIKEILAKMINQHGNTNIDVIKQEDVIKIMKKENLKELVSLKEKIIELENSLYETKRGVLYKAVLDEIERPLIEHVLERTEGNQLKAARILGLNRNTIRAKIKKLGINTQLYKQ